ncbi:unnamed protein product, partial [Amoebophrya sp. A25]
QHVINRVQELAPSVKKGSGSHETDEEQERELEHEQEEERHAFRPPKATPKDERRISPGLESFLKNPRQLVVGGDNPDHQLKPLREAFRNAPSLYKLLPAKLFAFADEIGQDKQKGVVFVTPNFCTSVTEPDEAFYLKAPRWVIWSRERSIWVLISNYEAEQCAAYLIRSRNVKSDVLLMPFLAVPAWAA